MRRNENTLKLPVPPETRDEVNYCLALQNRRIQSNKFLDQLRRFLHCPLQLKYAFFLFAHRKINGAQVIQEKRLAFSAPDRSLHLLECLFIVTYIVQTTNKRLDRKSVV